MWCNKEGQWSKPCFLVCFNFSDKMFPVYGFGARIPPDFKVGVQVNLPHSFGVYSTVSGLLKSIEHAGKVDKIHSRQKSQWITEAISALPERFVTLGLSAKIIIRSPQSTQPMKIIWKPLGLHITLFSWYRVPMPINYPTVPYPSRQFS